MDPIIDDCSDWIVVPSVNSFNLENDGNAGKIEDIDLNSDDERNSDSSSSESGSSISIIEEAENSFISEQHLPLNDLTFTTSPLNPATSILTSITQFSESQPIRSEKALNLQTKKASSEKDVLKESIDVSTVTETKGTEKKSVDVSTVTETKGSEKKSVDVSAVTETKGSEKKSVDVSTITEIKGILRTVIRFSYEPSIITELKTYLMVLFIYYVISEVVTLGVLFSYDYQNKSLNHTVEELQKENFLLKRQVLYNEQEENIKLEEKENATRQYLEQLMLGQKEITLLKEEIYLLEANYKILQNRCSVEKSSEPDSEKYNMEMKSNNQSTTKENPQFHQMIDSVNLKKYSELIMLFNEKLNLTKIEAYAPEDCFVSFSKNTIGSISLLSDEYSISAIFSDYSEALKFVENYIYEKDIKSRFAEYINTLKSMGFKSYESVKKLFLCLEQHGANYRYKQKVGKIKDVMNMLLKELNEVKIYEYSKNI